jgi:hypothetical protein
VFDEQLRGGRSRVFAQRSAEPGVALAALALVHGPEDRVTDASMVRLEIPASVAAHQPYEPPGDERFEDAEVRCGKELEQKVARQRSGRYRHEFERLPELRR